MRWFRTAARRTTPRWTWPRRRNQSPRWSRRIRNCSMRLGPLLLSGWTVLSPGWRQSSALKHPRFRRARRLCRMGLPGMIVPLYSEGPRMPLPFFRGARLGLAAAALCLPALFFPTGTPAQPAPRLEASRPLKVPALTYERYTLPNGLTVVLHEDHRLPLVA